MTSDFSQHIIIDNGSFSVKSGFNGENAPRSVIQNISGSINESSNTLLSENSYYIGSEAIVNSSNLSLSYPLESPGRLDIDQMEDIWSYILYKELKVLPEEHNIFHIEPVYSNIESRMKIAEIMFESFNIFNIHIEPHGPLSLWSTAKSTALIIESDHNHTQIIPVYEKHLIRKGLRIIDFAGKHLTSLYMIELAKKTPKNVFYSNIKEIARRIKEGYSEFSTIHTNKTETETDKDNTCFTLPDGNVINIGNERFIPDLIFNPSLFSSSSFSHSEFNYLLEIDPLHISVYKSIMDCDIHLRKDLLGNIVLSGGNTMIKGFADALKSNLLSLFNGKYEEDIKIFASSDRKYSIWNGASVICSIGNFQNMWISKNEYEESGESILMRNVLF